MSEGRKILFANQSSGSLTIDIVNAYEETGKFEKIELFVGRINIRPSVPNPSVRIIKTIKYDNRNNITRLLTWLLAYFHLLLLCWCRSKETELFIITNPPFNTFVPLFTNKQFYILIYDIYPDTLISQHIIGPESFFAQIWRRRNRTVYAKAKRVFTISEDMKREVAKYVDSSNISVIYNWSHNEMMVPVKKSENPFLKKHNIEDKFIVLYSGNMGMTHDIDVLVDVAQSLKDDDSILFLFIGEGGKKKLVEKKIHDYQLQNCIVLPYQDKDVLPYSMGAADIGIVTTATEQTGLSIPSKVNAYMSVGAILLCLADPYSELGKMVTNNNLGKCFNKSDIDAMASFIIQMKDNEVLANQIKMNSRRMSFYYTPENARKFIID